jgi:hypothetical protein
MNAESFNAGIALRKSRYILQSGTPEDFAGAAKNGMVYNKSHSHIKTVTPGFGIPQAL